MIFSISESGQGLGSENATGYQETCSRGTEARLCRRRGNVLDRPRFGFDI